MESVAANSCINQEVFFPETNFFVFERYNRWVFVWETKILVSDCNGTSLCRSVFLPTFFCAVIHGLY